MRVTVHNDSGGIFENVDDTNMNASDIAMAIRYVVMNAYAKGIEPGESFDISVVF